MLSRKTSNAVSRKIFSIWLTKNQTAETGILHIQYRTQMTIWSNGKIGQSATQAECPDLTRLYQMNKLTLAQVGDGSNKMSQRTFHTEADASIALTQSTATQSTPATITTHITTWHQQSQIPSKQCNLTAPIMIASTLKTTSDNGSPQPETNTDPETTKYPKKQFWPTSLQPY